MSRPEPVGVGVIGAGAMGAAHLRTLVRWVPGAEARAVYDADRPRAEQLGGEVGAEVSGSAQELIASDRVGAIVIAAPDGLHEEFALACLAAGKPTLCEKPLATSPAGSRRVVDAEVAVGRRLVQVGFMRRYDPAYVELRELVAAGTVGPVRMVHCVHRNAQANPDATSEGVIVNSMIHELDVVPWLLDDPVVAVTVSTPTSPPGQMRDAQVAVLETAGGALVTVEVFVNARYGYDVQCEVVGDVGTVRLTPPYGLALRSHGLDGVRVSTDFVDRFADAYRIELAAWVEGVRRREVSGPTAWAGHCADTVAAAGVESLRSGRRVLVADLERPKLYR